MSAPESIREIFQLTFRRQFVGGQWGVMPVGYYTSMEEVEAAKKRLLPRPGFCDFPDCFHVECYRVNTEYDDPMFFTHFPTEPPELGDSLSASLLTCSSTRPWMR